MLRVHLLGPVGADATRGERDRVELPLGGPKPRSVLAVLALAAPRTCSTEQIVDGLWGEQPPASARNAVQVNVTALRKALGAHGVEVTRIGDGYALLGPLALDVAEFEQGVAAGRAALRSGDAARARQLLTSALELWRGTPFDGLDGAPFAEVARPPLLVTRSAALVDLADAYLRLADPAEAARTSQLLLADQPYDERGWILLATAHYWLGQQDVALATCRKARQVLLDELGVDPTAALADVEDQILNHAMPDRARGTNEAEVGGGQQDAAAAAHRPLPALPERVIGRDGPADEVLARLAAGERLVTLVGIGGIGKTTLALTVAHRLTEAGRHVTFSAHETDLDVPAAWARLCGALAVDPGDDAGASLAAAAAGVGVLVLDNLEQVAGIGRALDELLAAAPELVVVATSRRPTGARVEHPIAVPPLDTDSSQQLFLEHAERHRTGIGTTQPEPVRELCALLDGIPLALELAAGRVRTLTPQQLLSRIRDRRGSVLEGSAAVAVPDRQASLLGVLQEAYDTLAEPGQRLFELLGSFDGWVSLELLEASATGWVEAFLDALDELVGCGLVALDLDGRARMRGPVREFAHSLGPRADLDDRLIAQTLVMAELRAPQLFGASTSEALAALGRDEDTLTVALALATSRGATDADVAEVAGSLVLCLNRFWLLGGRLPEGRRWIQRAVELDGLSGPTAARLGVLAGTFGSYLSEPDTVATLEVALARVQECELPVDRLQVNGWCCLAAFAAHHHDFDLADRAARQAAALAATSGDPSLVALARDIDGHVASYLGDHERSLTANFSGLADALQSGDEYGAVNLLVDTVVDLLYLGRLDEALAYADEAFDLSLTLDAPHMVGVILLVRGSALTAAGRVPAARGNLLEALRISRDRYPDPLMTADVVFTLGTCSAQELSDTLACRCFGAAEALYGQQGMSATERLAAPILAHRDELRNRLGDARFDSLAALGAGAPERTLELLVAEQVSADQILGV